MTTQPPTSQPPDIEGLNLLELEYLLDALQSGRAVLYSRSKAVSKDSPHLTTLCLQYVMAQMKGE